MQIHITNVTPNAAGGHTITIDTSGEQGTTPGVILMLGQDVSAALADGKISMLEALKIVADLSAMR
jgi:hypothetical protein